MALSKDCPGRALETSQTHFAIIFDPLWVYGLLGDALTSTVSNSHCGKRLGARDMIIFVAHLLHHATDNTFIL